MAEADSEQRLGVRRVMKRDSSVSKNFESRVSRVYCKF